MKQETKKGLEEIHKAIEVRAQITQLYEQYRRASSAAAMVAGIKHHDFKRAVDAIYYLGGGWPSENSRGRMEALVENFIGMYHVLSFIGHADIVDAHLAKFGFKVTVDPRFKLDEKDITAKEREYLRREFSLGNIIDDQHDKASKLVSTLVDFCEGLQGQICKLADSIKDGHRLRAKELLGVEQEEYDRLHTLVKFSVAKRNPKKVTDKRLAFGESISNFNAAAVYIKPR